MITGVEFYCVASMQGAHYDLLLMLTMPPGERQTDSTFGGMAAINAPSYWIYCASHR